MPNSKMNISGPFDCFFLQSIIVSGVHSEWYEKEHKNLEFMIFKTALYE